MGKNLREEEQYLLQTATDFLIRMTELEKLREAVRLAEVAKALLAEDLPRRLVNSKVVDLFARSQCGFNQRGRLPRPDQLSDG